MLDRHQRRAAPLASDSEALQKAQHDEQDRSPEPDSLEGRQEADQERGPAHDEQRDHQHCLAPDAVSEVPEDHPADRAGEETHAEGGKRSQRPGERSEGREEQLIEDQRRRSSIEEDVAPLDRGPYKSL
jgi:hypothetical protein